jgi:primosomal protein N'
MEQLTPSEHHIWCNFFMRPREGCTQCESLFSRYPDVSRENLDEAMQKHFPNVKVLK